MALIVTGILCAPPAPPAPPPTPTENRHSLLKKATSWGYQLQKANINELAASSHDVLVIDYAREDGTPWTEAEIQQLKQRAGRPRTVLAYISVGEAEDYRPYWRKDWRTSPPKWLGKENPEWKGNYPVRYWDPGWQVLFVGPGGYLDQIHSQGFDGVYLDRIDVYMQWGPTGTKKPELNAPAMVQWVERIAFHLRTTRGRPDALVVGQNGPLLAQHPRYVDIVDSVALEDLFYDDNRRQPLEETEFILDALKPLARRNLPIFVVDYMQTRSARRRFPKLARARGLIPYAAPGRELDRLGP